MKKLIGRVVRWVRGDGEADGPADRSPTPHVWQVGDMAECIMPADKFWRCGSWRGEGPVRGEIRCVTEVKIDHLLTRDGHSEGLTTGLRFARYPYTYVASAFRPVKPRADARERCADEFALLTELIGDRQKMPQIPVTTDETTETGNRT